MENEFQNVNKTVKTQKKLETDHNAEVVERIEISTQAVQEDEEFLQQAPVQIQENQTVMKAKALTPAEQKAKEIADIRAYEAKTGDYLQYGIGFGPDFAEENPLDSKYMKAIRRALKRYFDVRDAIFEDSKQKERFDRKNLQEVSPQTLTDRRDKKERIRIVIEGTAEGLRFFPDPDRLP